MNTLAFVILMILIPTSLQQTPPASTPNQVFNSSSTSETYVPSATPSTSLSALDNSTSNEAVGSDESSTDESVESISTTPSPSRYQVTPSNSQQASPTPAQNLVNLTCEPKTDVTKPSSVCSINDLIVPAFHTLILNNYTTLQVSNLTFEARSSGLILNSNQLIQCSDVVLDGQLQLMLNKEDVTQIQGSGSGSILNKTVIEYESRQGSFDSINVVDAAQECVFGAQPYYGPKSLQVLITLTSCATTGTGNGAAGGDGGVNKGLIVGVVLGVGGGMILCGLILFIIVGVVTFLVKKRQKTELEGLCNTL